MALLAGSGHLTALHLEHVSGLDSCDLRTIGQHFRALGLYQISLPSMSFFYAKFLSRSECELCFRELLTDELLSVQRSHGQEGLSKSLIYLLYINQYFV